MNALVCDLGGTNCRFALWQTQTRTLSHMDSFRNDDFTGFGEVVVRYMAKHALPGLDSAAIALAAPCESDNIALTNRDWVLSRAEIAAVSGAQNVHFLNDLEALALAVHATPGPVVTPVAPSVGQAHNATRLVVSTGTGFNSAAVTRTGSIVACETGHTTFAPLTDFDRQFQVWATGKFGRCSNERLLSGKGLESIEALLSGKAPRSSHDIISAGMQRTDPIARQACVELARILGTVTGDLALTFMAEGGVYLAGGIARAISPLLTEETGPFRTAFAQKGRMGDQMKRFPILLIEDDSAALLGCAAAHT